MLLQTNSYVVPRDKRMEHARVLRRFRQTLLRLGCDHFEVYEQVGANWAPGETSGRYVQIMRFRDRKHQLAVQAAERSDPSAQALLQEFCELINLPYQQQQGLFAVGFYTSFLRMPTSQQIAEWGGQETSQEPPQQPVEATIISAEAPIDETPTPGGSGEETAAPEASQEESTEESQQDSQSETPEESTDDLTPVLTQPVASETHEPEMEIPELSASEENALNLEETPNESEAHESESHESNALADTNGESLHTDPRHDLPIDSDGMDSESVFLGALEGDLEEPGSLRPLSLDDDAETEPHRPARPSK
jgi:hypothetical protein